MGKSSLRSSGIISSKSYTDQFFAKRAMTILVESDTTVARWRCRWPEVKSGRISAPVVAAFLTFCVARHEEASEEGSITDQELVVMFWDRYAAPIPRCS